MWELPGHVIFFSVMTYLWQRVFAQSHDHQKALLMAASLATLIGVTTESGQYLVGRDALLVDLLADLVGIGLVGLIHLGTAVMVRWVFQSTALAWTGFVVYVLLRPGVPPAWGPPFILFEPTPGALWDGVGVLVFFVVLPYLWQRVLAQYYGRQPALVIAACLGVLISIATEFGRIFGRRDALLVDLIASFIGIGLFLFTHFAAATLARLDSGGSE